MGAFDDIKLDWHGKEYTIPANRVLRAIACIEDVLTLNELATYSARNAVPFAKIASAYGAVLRYAGATVTDEDVYAGMLQSEDEGVTVTAALGGLLAMMMPKQKDTKPGNAGAPPAQVGKKKSSGNASRPQ